MLCVLKTLKKQTALFNPLGELAPAHIQGRKTL